MITRVRVIRLTPHNWDVLVPDHPTPIRIRQHTTTSAVTVSVDDQIHAFFQTDVDALTAIFRGIARFEKDSGRTD